MRTSGLVGDLDVTRRASRDYRTRKATMQLSHWRQLLAAPLVANTAFLSGDVLTD